MLQFKNKDIKTTSLTKFEISRILKRKKALKLFQDNIE